MHINNTFVDEILTRFALVVMIISSLHIVTRKSFDLIVDQPGVPTQNVWLKQVGFKMQLVSCSLSHEFIAKIGNA